MNINNFQYYTEKLWDKIKTSFMSKDEVALLEKDWSLVATVVANNTITLPSLDTFNEVYIEMSRLDGTIMHKEEFKKDSLLFESSNTTREILLDSISDASTYLTYDMETNTITPRCIEGIVITEESTDVHTSVYIMQQDISSTTLSAKSVSYDNAESGLEVDNVQGAIDTVNENVNSVIENLETTNNSLAEIDLKIEGLGNGTNEEVKIMTSNLQDWVAHGYTKDTSITFNTPVAIAYGNGMYVAVDSDFNAISSTDGVNWNMPLLASDLHTNANDITYGNGVFVAVGNIGYVAVIPNDGTEGTTIFSGVSSGHPLNSVAYGDGRFVTVGAYGNSGYSTDNGNTWTAMTGLSSSISYNSVAYGKGIFVAVGTKGYYAISTNGTSWTEMTTGDGTDLNGVAIGKNINGDVFVFVGAKGKVYYTYDGINIKPGIDYYGEDFTSDLYSVVYGNDRFIAVGAGGTCRFTTGARRWADVSGLHYNQKYIDVIFVDDKFITISQNNQSSIYMAEYEKVTITLEDFMQQTNVNDVLITVDLSDKADIDHTHDDRYYTQAEVDAMMENVSNSLEWIEYNEFSGSNAVEHGINFDYKELMVCNVSGNCGIAIIPKILITDTLTPYYYSGGTTAFFHLSLTQIYPLGNRVKIYYR